MIFKKHKMQIECKESNLDLDVIRILEIEGLYILKIKIVVGFYDLYPQKFENIQGQFFGLYLK